MRISELLFNALTNTCDRNGGLFTSSIERKQDKITRLNVQLKNLNGFRNAIGKGRNEVIRSNNYRRSFANILEQVASQNSARLIARARLANRLAKSGEGRSRAKAYQIKNQALKAFASRFPDRVFIERDPNQPWLFLVHFRSTQWALHMPSYVMIKEHGQNADLAA